MISKTAIDIMDGVADVFDLNKRERRKIENDLKKIKKRVAPMVTGLASGTAIGHLSKNRNLGRLAGGLAGFGVGHSYEGNRVKRKKRRLYKKLEKLN